MNGSAESRQALVAALRREVGRLEADGPVKDEQPVSTGVAALDRLLPAGGLKRGTLVEYLAAGHGCGAGALALSAARLACGEERSLVVVEKAGKTREEEYSRRKLPVARFYPPGAAAWGVDLSRLLVLRPASEADALWALDQALRCPGVGAVWAQWDVFDARDFRRLQLAAECGGTLGLLIRPVRRRGQPTWADVQWEVRARRSESEGRKSKVEGRRSKVARSSTLSLGLRPWSIEVELVRCRGKAGSCVVALELDEAAGSWREVTDESPRAVPVLDRVADSASAWRA